MNNVTQKIRAFIQTDGVKATLKYIMSRINSFFYKKSDTIFYMLDLGNENVAEVNTRDDIETRVVEDYKTFLTYDYPRLRFMPAREWFENGAKCLFFLKEGCFVVKKDYEEL